MPLPQASSRCDNSRRHSRSRNTGWAHGNPDDQRPISIAGVRRSRGAANLPIPSLRRRGAVSPMLKFSGIQAELQDDIDRHRVVVFVGAGVSMAAVPSKKELLSWKGLIEDAANRCVDRGFINEGRRTLIGNVLLGNTARDFVFAADEATKPLREPSLGVFTRWLSDVFRDLIPEHPEVLRAVRDLGLPIITTNYDSLLEHGSELQPVTWREAYKVQQVLRGDREAVAHIHGHWDTPDSVIFGIESYFTGVMKSDMIQVLQRAFVVDKTVLFLGVGSGMDDPNVGALRDWMTRELSASQYEHYWLARSGSDSSSSFLDTLSAARIRAVAYDGDLVDCLTRLKPPRTSRPLVQPAADDIAQPGAHDVAPAGAEDVAHAGADDIRAAGADAVSPGPTAARHAAERTYRNWLRQSNDIIELSRLPQRPTGAVGPDELRRLYVPLRFDEYLETDINRNDPTGETARVGDDAGLNQAMQGRTAGRQTRSVSDPGQVADETIVAAAPEKGANKQRGRRSRLSIGECLSLSRGLVVLGSAGAGKSTLLRWMVTAYLMRADQEPAWEDFPDRDVLSDEDLLPVIVRCRELKQAPESIEDLVKAALTDSPLTLPQQELLVPAIVERMRDGTALLLFDGLDEVQDAPIRPFCELVEWFNDSFPRTRIIVTSRLSAYRELGQRIGQGFAHFSVAALTDSDKDAFASR